MHRSLPTSARGCAPARLRCAARARDRVLLVRLPSASVAHIRIPRPHRTPITARPLRLLRLRRLHRRNRCRRRNRRHIASAAPAGATRRTRQRALRQQTADVLQTTMALGSTERESERRRVVVGGGLAAARLESARSVADGARRAQPTQGRRARARRKRRRRAELLAIARQELGAGRQAGRRGVSAGEA